MKRSKKVSGRRRTVLRSKRQSVLWAPAPGDEMGDGLKKSASADDDPLSTAHLRAVQEQVLLLQRSSNYAVTRHAQLSGQQDADSEFRRTVEHAVPYYWAWQICEMVEVGARTVPEWRLQAKDLVTPYGFSWFAQPLPMYDPYKERTSEGNPGDHWMTGFCWGSQQDGGIWVYTLYQAKPNIMQTGRQFGGSARPGRGFRWRFGETIRDALLAEPDPRYRGRIFRELDYVSACLLFLNQRVVRVDTRGADRRVDARGPSVPAAPAPLVRTVQLRRVSTVRDHDTVPHRVEWSHRWLVSAHWRQQFYRSTEEHRPVLILPYVKGPEDKPLKPPRAKVFAVIR